METLFLAFVTAAGFVLLWIKILGFPRAMRFQVIGDLLITGCLFYIAQGTYSGMVLAAITGFIVSASLWAMNTITS